MYSRIDKATEYLRSIVKMRPYCFVLCNSGLNNLINDMSIAVEIPFANIEGFVSSKNENANSKLVYGILEDKYVLLVIDAPSLYEGISKEDYAYIYRVFANLGIKTGVFTSSCGSLNEEMPIGTTVLLEDHISLFSPNLLIGDNYSRFGPRIIDCSNIYNKTIVDLLLKSLNSEEKLLVPGVYSYYSGPSYETPADVKALKTLGADVIGMCIVPEATLCHQMGMNIVGVAHVTNMASGISKRPLSYREISSSAKRDEESQRKLIRKVIKTLPKE